MPTFFFDGIPPEDLEGLLQRLERRHYPAGSIVIAEGEMSREIYVTESGSAEVTVSDRAGAEHVVGQAGPGTTLGEMSLFTGQPAVATVRAVDDLEVLVLSEAAFERLCAAYPQVYRNLGAILSERLALTDRLAIREEPGRLVLLEDGDTEPLLAYALACSVAWHTRASTLLLVVDASPHSTLRALATEPDAEVVAGAARVHTLPPVGASGPEALVRTVEELCTRWDHVLLAVSGTPPVFEASRRVRLGALSVPASEAADERALQEGSLPATTALGMALGSIVRDLTGLKVGVALGAGSIRGFAHWGALEALEQMGVPIDYVAGSSVGGSVGAMYASGIRGQEGVELFAKGASTLFRPTVPVKSLLSSRALSKFLHGIHGEDRIEDLSPPLALVTTDIRTQRAIVLRRGLVYKAVLATLAIPGIFPAQRSGPYTLVDGGVLHPVPTGVAAEMGADVVVGVQLLGRPAPDDVDAELEEETSAPQPSALAGIMRAIEIMQTRVAPEPVEATSILITPALKNLPGMKLRQFSAGVRYVEAGAVAAETARPRLAAALPWLRS
jgi:NTE family protein